MCVGFMKVKLLTVRHRLELYQYFEERAKDEGVSISRYVVKLPEVTQGGKEDGVVFYSKEELDASIREAEEDTRNGREKTFKSAGEMFATLAEETE